MRVAAKRRRVCGRRRASWSRRIALTHFSPPLTESDADPQHALTEDLFAAYSERVYAYCLRVLGSPEEAEDALQETYCNAWASLRRGCQPRDPRAWLFAIAHNACGSLLRVRARIAREHPRPGDEIDSAFAGAEPDRDRLIGLGRAIDSLPHKQRRALLLREWRGLSYHEVAAELGVSLAAAETLIFRARNSVATALDRGPRPAWHAGLRGIAIAPLAVADSAKTALASLFDETVGTTKWALRFALGATAPLVVFGIVQGTLEQGAGPRTEQAAVASRPASAPLAATGMEVREPRPTERAQNRSDAPHDGGVAGATAQATPTSPANPEAEPPTPSADASSPPPAQGPSSRGGAARITICHRAGSQKTVTITIAEPAIGAHLGHGDAQGPCP
jgi:RNA polymerase sigma-70 factor, ECF subfamily